MLRIGYLAAVLALALLWPAEPVMAADYVREYTAPQTLDDFEGLIERESTNKILIIMYHATWCPYCQTLTQQYEEAIFHTDVPYQVIRIDVEKYPALAGAMKTQRGVPESHIFVANKRLHHFIGQAPDAEGLARYIEQFADKLPAKATLPNAPVPQ